MTEGMEEVDSVTFMKRLIMFLDMLEVSFFSESISSLSLSVLMVNVDLAEAELGELQLLLV